MSLCKAITISKSRLCNEQITTYI